MLKAFFLVCFAIAFMVTDMKKLDYGIQEASCALWHRFKLLHGLQLHTIEKKNCD